MLLIKGTCNDINLVEGLKNDVQVLKDKYNALEKAVKDLQSICNTLQRALETYRQHIVSHEHQETLNLSYQGEEFEVMS